MLDTMDISHEFLTHSIKVTLECAKTGEFNAKGDLRKAYFVGATLCLDVEDKINDRDVITICHSSECFGLFSGGIRRLLPIESLKLLEELMKECNINHTPKWLV
jgi:hypothetical protein